MRTILLAISTLFVASSCTDSQKARGFEHVNAETLTGNTKFLAIEEGLNKRIVIEEFNKDAQIFLPEIVDTVYGVRLDNAPEALIGSIDKIRLTDEAIYLLDKYYTKSVKKFDRSGKFLAEFGRQGKGPGEHYEPTDFVITGNNVIIYDQFKRVLNFYNAEGEFIKAESVPFLAISFHSDNDSTFVFHTLDSDNYHLPKVLNYSLLWVDSAFTIQYAAGYRENDKYSSFLSKNNMDNFNNRLYYHEPYSDTVFRISSEAKIYYDYVFSFPNNQLPDELLLRGNEKKLGSNNQYALNWNNPIVTDDFLYTTLSVNSTVFTVFFSNSTDNIKFTSGAYHDSTSILFRPFSNILNCEGNVLVGYQDALELYNRTIELKNNNGFDQLDKRLQAFVKDVGKNDNPILVFYQLRAF